MTLNNLPSFCGNVIAGQNATAALWLVVRPVKLLKSIVRFGVGQHLFNSIDPTEFGNSSFTILSYTQFLLI